MEQLLGYLGALLIGLTLGSIGGGGSILTVPVLVYLLGMDPVQATGYSLFIVGVTSAFGAARYIMIDLCKLRAGLFFAVPSMLAVFLTRRYLLPALPDPIFQAGALEVEKGVFIMTLFALLMIGTSYSMIRGFGNKSEKNGSGLMITDYLLIMAGGVVVGILAGMVGAGGGFLIVPALLLLARIDMREAVGTSLFVIAIQSLIGFLGEIGKDSVPIDLSFLLIFSGVAVAGALIGIYLSHFIRSERLRPIFGVFVLLMAAWILVAEWSGLSGIQ